jgi:hypothetical protein
VRPAHPDFSARRIIRADDLRAFPPRAGRGEETVRRDLDFNRRLLPRFMPDPEEATPAPVECERGVALEEKFVKRSRFAPMEIFAGWTRAITQQAVISFHRSVQDALPIRVIIGNAAKSVWQPE